MDASPPDARPVLRICDGGGDAACTLGRVTATRPLEDGGVAVAQSDTAVIVFDSAGAVAGALGRIGRGPGEHLVVRDLAEVAGDSLRVLDDRGWRVSVLDRRSGAGRSLPIAPRGNVEEMRLDADAVVLMVAPPAAAPGARVTASVRRVAERGEEERARVEILSYRVGGDGDGVSRSGDPFAPATHWCISPSGRIALANGDDWHLTLIDGNGTVRTDTLTTLPRDSLVLDDMVARLAPGSRSPDAVLRRRARTQLRVGVRVHPTVSALACDDNVIVWQTSQRLARGHVRWRLLGWDGRAFGDLRVSTTSHLSSVGHGRAIATAYDPETFVPYIAVYRLPATH